MSAAHVPAIDWLKAIGILLIVQGHVASFWTANRLPPINTKQLGVALFFFVLGYGLARERRPAAVVVFRRIFPVYFIGLVFLPVVAGLQRYFQGDWQESNFLPFAGGVNVLEDGFPANPSLWFVGTYLHALLFWAFCLRGRTVQTWHVAAVVAAEIPLRVLAMAQWGLHPAYMLLPNWAGVMGLGLYTGARHEADPSSGAPANGWAWGALAVFLIAWSAVLSNLPHDPGRFPFKMLSAGSVWGDRMATSGAVSVLYLAFTWLVFQSTRSLAVPAAMRLLSRHTLMLFLLHMPLYYLALDGLGLREAHRWLRAAVLLPLCLVGLTAFSELVDRLLRPRQLRDWLAGRLFGASGQHATDN